MLSDTHGKLNPRVLEIFDGVRRIYHCGDIGNQTVATDLGAIAPVRAVCGNMDPWPVAGAWTDKLVEDAEFGVVAMCHGARYGHANRSILLALTRLFDPAAPRAVLFGHSHRPLVEERNGILFVNPGSASIAPHDLTPTVALLEYDPSGNALSARLVPVES